MSFVNSINYAMESAIEKLRGWADMVRGMDEKYKLLALNGLPQVIFYQNNCFWESYLAYLWVSQLPKCLDFQLTILLWSDECFIQFIPT